MSNFHIGASKIEVSLGAAINFNMQGFAIEDQIAKSQAMKFYSRAFVIADLAQSRQIAVVVVDVWSCTESIKKAVFEQFKTLWPEGLRIFNEQNVQITGTHTHSGPAGISEYRLYNFSTGGFKREVRDAYAKAICLSIRKAWNSTRPGKVYLRTRRVEKCGGNRSRAAYLNNPAPERARYDADTDKAMTILIFVTNRANERIGVLTWYPIHATDLGQSNTKLHGDNKGVAAQVFESAQSDTFVAGFANSNAGDVSGNMDYASLPDANPQRAIDHGKRQADFQSFLELPIQGEELHGDVDYAYSCVDMSKVTIDGTNRRTYVGALGLSTFAGSTEDSTPPWPASYLVEGIVEGQVDLVQGAIQLFLLTFGSEKNAAMELVRYVFRDHPLVAAGLTALAPLWAGPALAAGAGATIVQLWKGDIRAKSLLELSQKDVKGHSPKPITMVTAGIAPSQLPLQILRIGNLVILGIPGEPTTMAGRRLRKSVLEKYRTATGHKVNNVVVSGYANAYSQYITTKEEYDKQHYEGASTLFGPHTLEAYMQEFGRLVR